MTVQRSRFWVNSENAAAAECRQIAAAERTLAQRGAFFICENNPIKRLSDIQANLPAKLPAARLAKLLNY